MSVQCGDHWILLAEFSETEGPVMLMSLPDFAESSSGASIGGMQIDVQRLLAELLAVDFSFIPHSITSIDNVSDAMQFVHATTSPCKSHPHLHSHAVYFTLNDIEARGFARRICFVLLSKSSSPPVCLVGNGGGLSETKKVETFMLDVEQLVLSNLWASNQVAFLQDILAHSDAANEEMQNLAQSVVKKLDVFARDSSSLAVMGTIRDDIVATFSAIKLSMISIDHSIKQSDTSTATTLAAYQNLTWNSSRKSLDAPLRDWTEILHPLNAAIAVVDDLQACFTDLLSVTSSSFTQKLGNYPVIIGAHFNIGYLDHPVIAHIECTDIMTSSAIFEKEKVGNGIGSLFISKYNFAIHVLYAILSGVSVIITASSDKEEHVRQLISLLTLLVPGYGFKSSCHALAWVDNIDTLLISLPDLSQIKLMGMLKTRNNLQKIDENSAIIDYDSDAYFGIKYQHGRILKDLFKQLPKSCNNNDILFFSQFRSTLAEIHECAYIYNSMIRNRVFSFEKEPEPDYNAPNNQQNSFSASILYSQTKFKRSNSKSKLAGLKGRRGSISTAGGSGTSKSSDWKSVLGAYSRDRKGAYATVHAVPLRKTNSADSQSQGQKPGTLMELFTSTVSPPTLVLDCDNSIDQVNKNGLALPQETSGIGEELKAKSKSVGGESSNDEDLVGRLRGLSKSSLDLIVRDKRQTKSFNDYDDGNHIAGESRQSSPSVVAIDSQCAEGKIIVCTKNGSQEQQQKQNCPNNAEKKTKKQRIKALLSLGRGFTPTEEDVDGQRKGDPVEMCRDEWPSGWNNVKENVWNILNIVEEDVIIVMYFSQLFWHPLLQ